MMACFSFSYVFQCLTVCVFMLIHIGIWSARCSYVVTSYNHCQAHVDRFRSFKGYSITDCVKECQLCSHCYALNLIQQINVCELFSSVEDGTRNNGNCIYVKRSDIQDIQIPCSECLYGETCDRASKRCKIKECVNTTNPENGRVLGNLKGVGNVIKYKCDKHYKGKNGITTATCLENGTWSEAECIRDCGEPSMQNAFISHGGTFEGATRNVTCLSGTKIDLNQEVSTIQCAMNGSWLPIDITCSRFNRVVFRALAGTGQGAAEAWMTGTGTTSDIKCRNPMNNDCTAHYRDPRIDDWESLNVQKVRYSIYKDGIEVVWVLFDGTGSNMMNWFQASRIIDSSYSDLSPTSEFNVFSIDPQILHRKFYVSVSFNGCQDDMLYFTTLDQKGFCWYDQHLSYPQFFYSALDTMAKSFNDDHFGYGDTVLIALYN